MTTLNKTAGILPLHKSRGAVRNINKPLHQVNLRAEETRQFEGDNRWRLITCLSGRVWITQHKDLQDYMLEAGDMFLVTLPGSVVVQAMEESSVEISPSLKAASFRGEQVFYP
jgi:hypothetical protein